MNYANIKHCDIANGPGVRTSLFVSGCTHHCPNCFNAVAWDFHFGQPFTWETEQSIIESCQSAYVAGLTLLGGEPMEPENQSALLPFLKRFRENCPGKTVWCYSGYTLEQLSGQEPGRCRCECTDELLSLIDVLVDGEFVQEPAFPRLQQPAHDCPAADAGGGARGVLVGRAHLCQPHPAQTEVTLHM